MSYLEGDRQSGDQLESSDNVWQGAAAEQWMPLSVITSPQAGLREPASGKARDGQAEPAKPGEVGASGPAPVLQPLRAGLDFEVPAPVAANLRGDNYLRDRVDNTPQRVRDHVATLIGRLTSPATRGAAQEGLREYGPAAVPQLIGALDSNVWQIRDQASRQLRLMGEAALPGLITYLDGPPASAEARQRAEQLRNDMVLMIKGSVYDAQGRIRRQFDPFGRQFFFSADYDEQGRVTSARWDNEQFRRNPNGSYSREGYDGVPFTDVSITPEGSLRFTAGDTTMQWSRDGVARAFGPDGRQRFSSSYSGSIQIPVRVGDNVYDVPALPVPVLDLYEKKR